MEYKLLLRKISVLSIQMKGRYERTLVLLVVVLTFLALPSFAEPFEIALNDTLGIRLGMDRDALPKSLPRREIRCVLPINDHALCRLSLKDQLTFAGARLRAAELQLENNKLTAISFDLDTSAEGPVPFVSLFNQQFGKQYGATKLPQACWQTPRRACCSSPTAVA